MTQQQRETPQLRHPGMSPDGERLPDGRDHTPVGFLQNAHHAAEGATHVEAVMVRPWNPDLDQHCGNVVLHNHGAYSDEPEARVRVTIGNAGGKGWAAARLDLTEERAEQLIADLQEQVGWLRAARYAASKHGPACTGMLTGDPAKCDCDA
jgi:hypothetical protein